MIVRGLIFAAFTAISLPVTTKAEIPSVFQVSLITKLVHPPELRNWRGARTEALLTLVWYPTNVDQHAQPREIGTPGHPIFLAHPIVPNAPIAPGRHPLVLLSHGTGGTADSLDWLASDLVEHGYVVVGVNHPGNNTLEPLTVAGFRLWWERARDLSDALNGVLNDPEIAPSIDPGRIGAAGFSLGGYTVLELAGARTDVSAFERFCKSPAADAICQPPETGRQASLDLDESDPATTASLAQSGASFRDGRVRSVFAIAPALGEAFDAAGLAGIKIPVAIVVGASDVTVPVATNAARFASLIHHTTLNVLPGNVKHYTFLEACVSAEINHLAAICQDAPGVDRATVHRQTAAMAVAFFTKTLDAQGASETRDR